MENESSRSSKLTQGLIRFYGSRKILWILLGLGLVLRLAQYLFNRSLWYDESMLALNIVHRTFAGLIQPLEYGQCAPVGFLIVEKLLLGLFGNSEYALRLFPLICGGVSLLLFYRVAAYYLGPKAVPIALALFAFSGPLIYYSSEVKQYSSDVAVTLALILAAIPVWSKGWTVPRALILGVAGGLAVWFSHPAILILAGIGFGMGAIRLVKRQWSGVWWLVGVGSVWVLSFALCYFVSLREATQNRYLLDFHQGSFMPFPPQALSDAIWFPKTFFSFFKAPGGFPLHNLAAWTFFVGLVLLFRDRREDLIVLTSPLVFVLLASGLHRYPLYERFMLFMVPFALLLIAAGTELILSRTPRVVSLTLIALLVLPPLSEAGFHLVKPRTVEEIRPCLSYLRDRRQEGDLLYLYARALPAYAYYSERSGFQESPYVLGVDSREDWSRYLADLDRLRGHKRVWLLFSNSSWLPGSDERKIFLGYLDHIGTRISSFEGAGSSVYLYDLPPG